MTRGPTTFALILSLLALALALALGLAASLALRGGLRAVADTYGRLVVSTALAADELSTHDDARSRAALAEIEKLGLHFSDTPPVPPDRRVLPMLAELQHRVGELLGDPDRVVVARVFDPEISIRSARDPRRWIVLSAVSYRQQVIASTLVISVVAGLIALAVAAIGARRLTLPLERLANNANDWLAGQPMDDSLRGSPREVRRLAEAIGTASENLRNAARQRELMLAGISHDLRTPLARLRIALELGDAADPLRSAAMIDDIEQLDSALEQCLAFVRDGRDEPLREIDLATIVGQLVSLRRQPDDWQVSTPPTLIAKARPTLLRRAIGNLMDNAERYGAAPFETTLWRDDDCVHVRVADCGPGVPQDLLDKLGRPFLRGDPARGGSGSGLGLSIVQRAAKLHGGELSLRNADTGGFVAEIRLRVDELQMAHRD